MEIGVLTEQNYEAWRFGKVSYLEKALDIFSFSAYKLLSIRKDEKLLYNITALEGFGVHQKKG